MSAEPSTWHARPPIRVCVVEDEPDLRRSLVRALERDGDAIVVGAASDDAHALKLVRDDARGPDVFVVDADLPTDGYVAASRIHRRHPELGLVMLGTSADWRVVERAVSSGARGFVTVSDPPETLTQTVVSVAHGADALENHRAWLSLQASPAPSTPAPAASSLLTPRQVQVMHVLAAGADDETGAGALGISPATFRVHVRRLALKLQALDRQALVEYASTHRFLVAGTPECIGVWDREHPSEPIERFEGGREADAHRRAAALESDARAAGRRARRLRELRDAIGRALGRLVPA
jgi:DNA-binding NarL/FixJ family response regulator